MFIRESADINKLSVVKMSDMYFVCILLVPPTINKFTVGEHLRLGQRVSMLCSVTDGDLPLSLKWYRHDQLLVPEVVSSSGISVTEIGNYESVLRIDNLRPEHNANFTCVAENFAGMAAHSQTLRVKGRGSPEVLLKSTTFLYLHTHLKRVIQFLISLIIKGQHFPLK